MSKDAAGERNRGGGREKERVRAATAAACGSWVDLGWILGGSWVDLG